MSVWFVIPSARPSEQVEPVLAKWRERGYKIALWRDEIDSVQANYIRGAPYPGYAQAVNHMAKFVLEADPECDWIVTGGDDTLPDPNHTAEEIADQCSDYFLKRHPNIRSDIPMIHPETFGVMQPTGDRFAGGSIDRIAGSPWMGREWCLRANQGKGPLWPEFTHMFVDECLKRTAEKLGVYWMRPDLIHFHQHFMRESDAIDARATKTDIPPHLVKWSGQDHWNEMKAVFKRLEAEDFKSCMPL